VNRLLLGEAGPDTFFCPDVVAETGEREAAGEETEAERDNENHALPPIGYQGKRYPQRVDGAANATWARILS